MPRARRRRRRRVTRLTDEFIDQVFARAAETIKEVEAQLVPVMRVPASARGLVIRKRG